MPKFLVERLVDAYAIYTTEVIADTAEEAYETARNIRGVGVIEWEEGGTREFDSCEYEVFDMNEDSVFCTIN
jgi:hypothetical protein